jgi:hypothetical protein
MPGLFCSRRNYIAAIGSLRDRPKRDSNTKLARLKPSATIEKRDFEDNASTLTIYSLGSPVLRLELYQSEVNLAITNRIPDTATHAAMTVIITIEMSCHAI